MENIAFCSPDVDEHLQNYLKAWKTSSKNCGIIFSTFPCNLGKSTIGFTLYSPIKSPYIELFLLRTKNSALLSPSINSFMNVNNSNLLLFIAAILKHVSTNRTCSIGKLRTHNKKHVITEPSKTPGSPSELDLWCFSVVFTHERGRLFHGEEADHICSVISAFMGLFKIYMYIYFNDLFDLSSRQWGRG